MGKGKRLKSKRTKERSNETTTVYEFTKEEWKDVCELGIQADIQILAAKKDPKIIKEFIEKARKTKERKS